MRQQTQPEIKTRKALSIGDRVTAWSMDANLALGNQYCIIRQCFYLYEIPMDSISLISLIPRLQPSTRRSCFHFEMFVSTSSQ
jgi:hypothetical protein